jgi:DNA mismatch endonuclease (patch repair protein)
MDVHDKDTRSYNMSKISAKNTSIEIIVRKFLHNNGFRYRLHNKGIPGNPDIVFPKKKIAIFLNGCFFHKHENCNFAATPKTNEEFWKKKIEGNIERDKKNEELLNKNGWNVIIIWECEIEPRKQKSLKRELVLKQLRNRIFEINSH